MEFIMESINWLIGTGEKIADLTLIQTITRTIIVYSIALLVIRLAKRRFMGNFSAFDILMGFVVGSILSRIITGREHILHGFLAITTIVVLHYLIAHLTFHFKGLSNLIKNDERQLIKDGKLDSNAMKLSKLGENDLRQALRQKGGVLDVKNVECAFLERDGTITVIPKKAEPKVVEVEVKEGVQTVKIVVG